MVFKASKGGVRSGNTLRGLHSLRARRYAGQACLVGRSSLPRKEVERLIERGTEDEDVANTLLNTDVVLSLNKRQRWSLPATVNHLVRSGQFSSSNAMFSVLERHKLRRRANCVGFVCNKRASGNKGMGQEKNQKKYFNFNLDYADQEESHRRRKIRMAEERRKMLKETKQKIKRDNRTDMESLVVTTNDGGEPTNTVESLAPIKKPDYCLEVLYPCPQSCSLTFNPKYTDVVMTQNGDGEMEVRPNVKSQKKSQLKHRKRLNTVDTISLVLETTVLEEDVEEMWQEALTDTEDGVVAESLAAFPEEPQSLHYDSTKCFDKGSFADLIERAQAQRGGAASKTRHRKRSGRHNSVANGTYLTPAKPHIFQVDQENYQVFRKENEELGTKNKTMPVTDIAEPKQVSKHPSTAVVLSTSEVTSENLERTFGHRYIEADCLPRRFSIDITQDVTNILSSPHRIISPAAYTTYLVFIHNGTYDEGTAAYKVLLNCALWKDTENISYGMPCTLTTIDTIVNVYVGNLLDMKDGGKLIIDDNFINSRTDVCAPLHELLMDKMKIQLDTYFTSEELSRASQSGRLKEEQAVIDEVESFQSRLEQLTEDYDADVVCEICYESVDSAQAQAASGTQLKSCRHLFCDPCWKTHLSTCLRDGILRMTCPGFRCNAQLGVSTLLSLLHVSEVSQILRRECENEVETSPTTKWCPSPSCGRVIRISSRKTNVQPNEYEFDPILVDKRVDHNICLDVHCFCGASWCFNCLGSAHWPAGCDQAQDYLEKIDTIKPIKDDRVEEVLKQPVTPVKPPKPPQVLEVEGRLCPKCWRFLEKDGGCQHISCPCGHDFCWECLHTYYSHEKCVPKPELLYKYTRRIKVTHVMKSTLTPDEDNQQEVKDSRPEKASRGRGQKATMYQRALQQQLEAKEANSWGPAIQELVIKICRTAGKDVQFKREVLVQCGVASSLTSESNDDLVRLQIADHVTGYLRSCQKAVLYLHHVIEFSFVLLQDCAVTSGRQRALRVISDLIGCCSFSQSVISTGAGQDVKTALRRLAEVEAWAKRALDALQATVSRLRV